MSNQSSRPSAPGTVRNLLEDDTTQQTSVAHAFALAAVSRH
ncbi:hypothetical protein [Nocardioides sp. GY 10127]|nr:hypothetical protein [Nocardioides sp. GY 10127]